MQYNYTEQILKKNNYINTLNKKVQQKRTKIAKQNYQW